MNWEERGKGAIPSFEEGSMRPINKCLVTLDRAQPGEVRILSRQWFDLPGSAECKVT